MSLLSRLGINTTLVQGQLKDNSPAVQKHLELMPPLLPDWAKEDMLNGEVGGYYQNPVNTISLTLSTYSNNIRNVTGIQEATNTTAIFAAANTLYYSIPAYIAHTNRLSGVTPVNQNTMTLPHLDNVINTGKMLTTLLFQVDGVQNNAPMVGGFSSLYTSNSYSNIANTIITYAGEIRNSINVSSYTDEGGNTYTTYTSNIVPSRANTMISVLNSVTSDMYNRRVNDETFYTNAQVIISEYSALKRFNKLGATETDMFNNLVGSDKLKERLDP